MITDEMRRLARIAFALEVSQIKRDVLLKDLTDDELESILDGVLAAVMHHKHIATDLTSESFDAVTSDRWDKVSCILCAGECRGHSFGQSWDPEPGSVLHSVATAQNRP